MKLFGKELSGPKPRLHGETRPVYNFVAEDAFVKVLRWAIDAQDPARHGSSYTDYATEFTNAVEIASRYCNSELLSRMNNFRDAVLDSSRGEGGKEEVDRTRAIFSKGCREALGTDQ